MSKEVVNLATELIDCRDLEVPHKLLKLKDILNNSANDPTKIKHEIYKYDILEAVSVSFKNEYGYIKEGWSLAVELAKIFSVCTTNFGSVDKRYQDTFLPTACENLLILAKKLQEKHVKSKAYSEEFFNLFKTIMLEYTKINSNNPFITLKSLNSQRLFQLLLSDEQNTSSVVMKTFKNLFMIKRSLISKLPEKSVHLILDEVIYKMASSELKEVGIAVFQLLVTLFQLDPSLVRLVVKRYKGLKSLTNKWKNKDIDKELAEFNSAYDGAYRNRVTNQELDEKAILIQKAWRGHMDRKRLKKLNDGFAQFQKKYRARRSLEEKKKQMSKARDELQFQLMLEHRRKQRQRNIQMLELLEVLPAHKIEDFLEKQREYSATVIQAGWRGYKARKEFNKQKEAIKRHRAAVKIQRETRRWLERNKKRRETPAFYSRPFGDPEKRELLFDKIRKHLDSIPARPRSASEQKDLHEKGQRLFQDYVINQRSMRHQQQRIQVLLAMATNDADLILNCPKLSQVTEEDVTSYYSHKSTPVMLAAKEAHKLMLKKQRAKWYELLDNSDSDDCNDGLGLNISHLNLDNNDAENYDREGGKTKAEQRNAIKMSVSKRQRNQLKTNHLRKSVSRMMNLNPDRSNIWNVEFDK